MITEKYPDAYDVSELVGLRTTSAQSIRTFAASKGVLIMGRGKEVVARILSRLQLDHQSYLDLRYYAQGGGARTSISGFNIRDWSTPHRTVRDIYEDVLRIRNALAEQKQASGTKKAPALDLRHPEIEGDSVRSEFSYQRVVPGKVELLARSNETVGFRISQIREGAWRVICFPKFNQDVETLEKLLKRAGKDAYEIYTIALDRFPVSQRIAFFDKLLEYYTMTSTEWSLRQVCGIVVRQSGKESDDGLFDIESDLSFDDVMNDEQSAKVAEPSDLRSITQAALEGENLRTNSFVKSCEKVGFYFSSMSLELGNKQTAEVAQVQVRFKLSPKMFEVIMLYTGIATEMGDESVRFTPERENEILTEAWIVSHQIWHEISNNLPTSSFSQRQAIMNLG